MHSDRDNREFELKIYIQEIKSQCENVLISTSIYNQGLNENNSNLVWFGVQSVLNYSGIVSRYFFRKNKLETLDNLKLKELFLIDDSSPLNERSLRNHFEHFDERVDRWLLKGNTIYIDRNITDSRETKNNMIYIEGQEDPVFLRHLIINEHAVSMYEDEINLEKLIKEIQRINEIAEQLTYEFKLY